jgi:hypothetical protein
MRKPLIWVVGLTLCASSVSADDGTVGTRRSGSHAAVGAVGAVAARGEQPPDTRIERLERLPDRLKQRLEALTGRWQNDSRVQTATTLVGLSAAAVGAAQGRHTIAFAGTHVMRWGLGRQLRAVEQRSGFQIAPSVGRHHIVITARKLFE